MSDFEQDVDDFEQALVQYKQRHGRMFPTCSEILEVARDIGFYRQPTLAEVDADEESDADSQTDDSPTSQADDEPILIQ